MPLPFKPCGRKRSCFYELPAVVVVPRPHPEHWSAASTLTGDLAGLTSQQGKVWMIHETVHRRTIQGKFRYFVWFAVTL